MLKCRKSFCLVTKVTGRVSLAGSCLQTTALLAYSRLELGLRAVCFLFRSVRLFVLLFLILLRLLFSLFGFLGGFLCSLLSRLFGLFDFLC